MKKKLRIAAVPRRFVHHDWGGIETYIIETAQCIKSLGHDIRIVCPSIFTEVHKEEIEGIPVTRTSYFYPYLGLSSKARQQMDKVGGNLFSFSLIRALLHVPALDIIHLHTGKRVGGIARTVAKLRKIPYVVTLHGGYFTIPKEEQENLESGKNGAFEWGKLLGWLVGSRSVLDDATAIICISRKEESILREKFPDKRIEYLPNGVFVEQYRSGNDADFRQTYAIADSKRVLLTVARISPQKNQLFLIEALPDLLNKDPDIHLVFIGSINDTEYHAQINRCIDELGVGDAVTIIPGLDPDNPLLVGSYHAADIFVLPSLHEPFGIVILEAWAAGTPVIASTAGGIPDFVDDGINGLLFDPADQQSFIEAYNSLTPMTAQSLSRAATDKVDEFSWNKVTARLIALYETAIEEYTD